MVDVVFVDFAGRDFDQAADDRDHVVARERLLVDLRNRHARRHVLALEFARELVAADAGEIVALLIEEQRLEQFLGVFRVFGFAGAQLLVDFLERVFLGLDVLVFFEAVRDQRRAVEQRQDRLIGLPVVAHVGPRERANERRRVDLAVLVDANADRTLGLVVLRAVVGLELDPSAAVGDDRRVERRPVVGVGVLQEVHARGTHELAHDHALRAVDHERALVGHEREIAHENFLVRDTLDFARLGGDETHADAQAARCRSCRVRGIPQPSTWARRGCGRRTRARGCP